MNIHGIGEYEQTIARSWYRSSYFRAVFTKATCPPAIRQCAEMFSKLVQPQTRNSLAVDMQSSAHDEDDYDDGSVAEDELDVDGPTVQVDRTIHLALAERLLGQAIPPTATSLSHCTRDGINYSIKHVHEGNSGILCRNSETPYCIEQILAFPNTERNRDIQGIWLVVRRHKQADVRWDPYRRYPLLRANLWSAQLGSTVEVLKLTDIDCHFAKCVIQWEQKEVAVVVSLSRVSHGCLFCFKADKGTI